MLSQLFSGNEVLESVAGDLDRISRTQHADDPAVGLVQAALLIWDPGALPEHGADGLYGDETASTVVRFKTDELGVPPEQIVDDVGPATVLRLDQLAAVSEQVAELGLVAVTTGGIDADGQAELVFAVEQAGGSIQLGLGDRAAVLTGGQELVDAMTGLVGGVLSGLVTPGAQELPDDIDVDTADAVLAWLMMAEPDYVLSQLDPSRLGMSFNVLDGCGQELLP